MSDDKKKAHKHIRDEYELLLNELAEEMAQMQLEGITSRDYLNFKLDQWKNKIQDVKYYVISTPGIG